MNLQSQDYLVKQKVAEFNTLLKKHQDLVNFLGEVQKEQLELKNIVNDKVIGSQLHQKNKMASILQEAAQMWKDSSLNLRESGTDSD